jgi:hypothetical protein
MLPTRRVSLAQSASDTSGIAAARRSRHPVQAKRKPKPAKQLPAVQKTPDMEGKDAFAVAQMLYSRMLDEILTKSEDVGAKFPEEARKIYYQETDARAIRGQATKEELTSSWTRAFPSLAFRLSRLTAWN